MGIKAHSILALSLICLHLNRITLAGDDASMACLEKLSAEDKKAAMAVMETCKKKLNLDAIPKPDEVEKNGFDDKVRLNAPKNAHSLRIYNKSENIYTADLVTH